MMKMERAMVPVNCQMHCWHKNTTARKVPPQQLLYALACLALVDNNLASPSPRTSSGNMSRIPGRKVSFHGSKKIIVAKHCIWASSNGADYVGIQIVHDVGSCKQDMRKTLVVLVFKLEHEIESNSARSICIDESRIGSVSQMFWRRKKETESRVLDKQSSLFPIAMNRKRSTPSHIYAIENAL